MTGWRADRRDRPVYDLEAGRPGAAPPGLLAAASTYAVRKAWVGERRAARMDGYNPAAAPMTRAALTPP